MGPKKIGYQDRRRMDLRSIISCQMSDFIIGGAKIPVQKVTFCLITGEVLLKSFAVSGLNLKYRFHTGVQKCIQ